MCVPAFTLRALLYQILPISLQQDCTVAAQVHRQVLAQTNQAKAKAIAYVSVSEALCQSHDVSQPIPAEEIDGITPHL